MSIMDKPTNQLLALICRIFDQSAEMLAYVNIEVALRAPFFTIIEIFVPPQSIAFQLLQWSNQAWQSMQGM